jgi:hypothetical protein
MVVAASAVGAGGAGAQETPPPSDTLVGRAAAGDTAVAAGSQVTVYLDCNACDFTYFRRQIPYVRFVRDPQVSALHVLVTQSQTGGGGRSYNLAFLGRDSFEGQQQTLTYVSPQSETDDGRRQGLARTLQMGLMSYLAQTPLAARIGFTFSGAGAASRATAVDDPWNSWVSRVGGGGSLDKEASQGEYQLDGSFSADRVTEEWKFRSGLRFEYEHQRFQDDDRWLTSATHDLSLNSSLIRSLTSRWSAGLFADAYSRTYENVARALRFTPGVEYNIFPWDVSDRKEFTVAYTAGIRSFRYAEETIYQRMGETLAFESLRSQLRLTQPWGEVYASIEGSHYFHDFGFYGIDARTNLSYRLTRGLSLDFGLQAESIHDQLSLPKGDATLEEILLRQRRLATTYQIGTRIGLRYTFGSIFNDVVNQRF